MATNIARTDSIALDCEARSVFFNTCKGLGFKARAGRDPWVLVHFGESTDHILGKLSETYHVTPERMSRELEGWVKFKTSDVLQAEALGLKLIAIATENVSALIANCPPSAEGLQELHRLVDAYQALWDHMQSRLTRRFSRRERG